MQISATKTKDIILIDKRGGEMRLKNKVMRKRMNSMDQRVALAPSSTLIVCNYAFYYGKDTFSSRIKAICHPFRKDDMFPRNIPKFHLSESDFCDQIWIRAKRLNVSKDYDVLFFTLNSVQGANCKGFSAIPLLADVAKDLGIRIKVIDYTNPNKLKNELRTDDYPSDSPKWSMWEVRDRLENSRVNLDYENRLLSEDELNEMVQRAKISIFPNTRDASPRMIPESLIRGTPVLVNKNIWGGWKYVNDQTGEFFNFPQTFNEFEKNRKFYKKSLIKSLDKMLSRNYNPERIKEEYYSEYGFIKTAKRLAKVFNRTHNLGDRFEYAVYTDFEQYLPKLKVKIKKPKRPRVP